METKKEIIARIKELAQEYEHVLDCGAITANQLDVLAWALGEKSRYDDNATIGRVTSVFMAGLTKYTEDLLKKTEDIIKAQREGTEDKNA